ncbi:hypothetical protein OAP63_00570 [Vibrio sp.]|nr:hypothetical protein [Vibrio sp.]
MNYAIAMNVIYAEKALREEAAEVETKRKNEAVAYTFSKPARKGFFSFLTQLFA